MAICRKAAVMTLMCAAHTWIPNTCSIMEHTVVGKEGKKKTNAKFQFKGDIDRKVIKQMTRGILSRL